MTLRTIAFYLPQYHPIPENDDWWGAGFTDWFNVAKARRRFRGHYQPHLPADLGFYDLRLAETREAQADLARSHGVAAFCYYHYWFNGKRLLERPFEEVRRSGSPDFPFCLCWANEDWTRRWDGRGGEVLLGQRYSAGDDRRHIHSLLAAFADPRYVRLSGCPLFLVYRASLLPEPRRTTDIWREEADKAGIGPLFLCRVESGPDEHGDPAKLGFDAAIEFQPDWAHVPHTLRGALHRTGRQLRLVSSADVRHRVFDYARTVDRMVARPPPPYRRLPCVMPGWDNTPRRARGAAVFHRSRPDLYGRWVRNVVNSDTVRGAPDPVLFVNAWNEWAEGAHLEPCQQWGTAYLEAHAGAVGGSTGPPC